MFLRARPSIGYPSLTKFFAGVIPRSMAGEDNNAPADSLHHEAGGFVASPIKIAPSIGGERNVSSSHRAHVSIKHEVGFKNGLQRMDRHLHRHTTCLIDAFFTTLHGLANGDDKVKDLTMA